MRKAVLLGVIAVFLLGWAPVVCRAQSVGDYASGAAPKGGGWNVPPGQYGLLASYADFFLSNGPNNGSYVITWAILTGNDNPDKADVLADFFIVDVRTATVFSGGHLAGAVNLPYPDLAKPSSLAVLPTDRPILVVCGSGLQSAQGAAILGMLGYNVRILSGGMAVVPASYKVTGQ